MTEEKNKSQDTEDEEVLEGEIVEDGPELVEETAEEISEEGALEDVDSLKNDLKEARQKAAENLDGWQRAAAELANYRRRVERDQQQTYQVAAGNVARRFLDVLDDMERALKNRPQGGDGAGWAEGIELVYRKLLNSLEAEGITRMDVTPGQEFDPNLYEAITHEENPDIPSGHVIDVVSPGYFIKDHVLRPARVRVAR
jgi:molecular chaperone GrpE